MPANNSLPPRQRPGFLSVRNVILLLAGILLLSCCTLALRIMNTSKICRKVAANAISQQDAIAELGGPQAALGRLRMLLRVLGVKKRVNNQALLLLGYCGREALPDLSKALQDSRSRRHALLALLVMGRDAAGLLDGIQAALSDPDSEVRASAASVLGRIGPEAESCREDVAKLINDPDDYVRCCAIIATGQLTPDRSELEAILKPLLKDRSRRIRSAAARALGKTGSEDQE